MNVVKDTEISVMWDILPRTKCRGCGRIFSSSKTRHDHERLRHPFLGWLVCPLCVSPTKFQSPSSTSLVQHIAELHLPVKCTKCGIRLETAVELQRHAALTLQPAPPIQVTVGPSGKPVAAELQLTPLSGRNLKHTLSQLQTGKTSERSGQPVTTPPQPSPRSVLKRVHSRIESEEDSSESMVWSDDEDEMVTAQSSLDTTYFDTEDPAPSGIRVTSAASSNGILRHLSGISGAKSPAKRVRFAKNKPDVHVTPLRGALPSDARMDGLASNPRIGEEQAVSDTIVDIRLQSCSARHSTVPESELMDTASSSI